MVQIEKTLTARRARALRIYAVLEKTYPEVRCTLDHRSPFELLVMTILAAQCTDARVNLVAGPLFKKYPGPAAFAKARPAELEAAIHSTGFFRNKAKNLIACAERLLEAYGGEVPVAMDDLLTLPGVGRKTANVIRAECFDAPGVIVDTHCGRLARRMGFTVLEDPVQVERDLQRLWPQPLWAMFSHYLVFHGRAQCMARAPQCGTCPVAGDCPYPRKKEPQARG